jgi:hypothetical protein
VPCGCIEVSPACDIRPSGRRSVYDLAQNKHRGCSAQAPLLCFLVDAGAELRQKLVCTAAPVRGRLHELVATRTNQGD